MIKLIKQNKKDKKTLYTIFDSFTELERELSSISTSKYDKNNYYIEADDFQKAIDFFKSFYNEDYYTIDDICGLIYINKLKIGQKRKKKFEKEKITNNSVIESAIGRLKRKIPSIEYNKETRTINFTLYTWKFEFNVNEDLTISESIITIKEQSMMLFSEVKEMLKQAKWVVIYFNKLSKRYEKKGDI